MAARASTIWSFTPGQPAVAAIQMIPLPLNKQVARTLVGGNLHGVTTRRAHPTLLTLNRCLSEAEVGGPEEAFGSLA